MNDKLTRVQDLKITIDELEKNLEAYKKQLEFLLKDIDDSNI